MALNVSFPGLLVLHVESELLAAATCTGIYQHYPFSFSLIQIQAVLQYSGNKFTGQFFCFYDCWIICIS